MKTKKVTLIARNKQGASIEYHGTSKADAMRRFRSEYDRKGWKIEYVDETGKTI
ncbi:MAG: hypothetical protein WC401_12965 [Bacteroidales bacterium]